MRKFLLLSAASVIAVPAFARDAPATPRQAEQASPVTANAAVAGQVDATAPAADVPQ